MCSTQRSTAKADGGGGGFGGPVALGERESEVNEKERKIG